MRRIVMVVMVALGIVWGAAAPRTAPPANLSDAQLEQDIRARLARSPKISLDHFTVKVQNGVATFEGKTDVIQHKGAATRMAHAAGAKNVVNRIQITDAARRRAADQLHRNVQAQQSGSGTASKGAMQAKPGPASGTAAAAEPGSGDDRRPKRAVIVKPASPPVP